MTSFITWNWANEHVQAELENGEYISSESTLVLAGPSQLSFIGNTLGGASSNALIPIGLIQNMSIGQNKQLTKLFEIGSKRGYFVPGRQYVNFNLSRVMFYGPSLLRLFYALAPLNDSQLGTFGTQLNVEKDSQGNVIGAIPQYNDLFPTSTLQLAPGWGGSADETTNRDFYINLASELFNVPFGLVLVFRDTRNRPYGACFLENCFIESHTFGIDSNSVIIAENAAGQCDIVRPIQLASII